MPRASHWFSHGLKKDATSNGKYLLFENFKLRLDFANNGVKDQVRSNGQSLAKINIAFSMWHAASHPHSFDGDVSAFQRDCPPPIEPKTKPRYSLDHHCSHTMGRRRQANHPRWRVRCRHGRPADHLHRCRFGLTASAPNKSDQLDLALESEAAAIACHHWVIAQQVAAIASTAANKEGDELGPRPGGWRAKRIWPPAVKFSLSTRVEVPLIARNTSFTSTRLR